MDYTRPGNPQKLLTLREAALKLGVSVDVLLKWNEYHILKPTITQTGEIGYTHDQINEFQTIRQFLQAQGQIPEVLEEKLMDTFEHKPHPQETVSPQSQQMSIPTAAATSSFALKRLSSPILLASIAGVVFVIAVSAFIVQGSIFTSTPLDNGLGGQTSTLIFTGPVGSTHFSETNTQNKNINEEGSVFGQKVSTVLNQKQVLAHTVTPTPSIKQSNKSSSAAELAAATVAKAQAQEADNPLLQDTTPLSSMSHPAAQKKDTTKSPFDANGNITGDVPKDTLASIVGGTNTYSPTNTFQQTDIQLRNQFIVLLMGALGFTALYLRKPKKLAPALQTSTQHEKVLEIDQKMDGTVVLSFQGNTFKVSKPELYSDSDRFIERLMELVEPGMKEVEYDSWTDEKIRLSAPLSRLVTRLGFVGIKRDLFFPRTSKNRVLFRKYITNDDLRSMGLTVEELAQDLLQNI